MRNHPKETRNAWRGFFLATTAVVMLAVPVLLGLMPVPRLSAQAQTARTADAEYARIEHANGSATLSVFNYSRPLLEGLAAVREEYGWEVYLEEPPHEIPPRGGKFESTYPEDPSRFVAPHAINAPQPFPLSYFLSDTVEASVLNKIVSDYNQAGFSGQYSVIPQPDGGYAVVGTGMQNADGTYHSVNPILDTPISIPNGTYRAGEALEMILNVLSSASGVKILPNPPNNWGGITVTVVGGNNVPARALLQQVVPPSMGMVWSLYYGPLEKLYVLNLLYVRRARYDNSGRKTTP
jgi:hypothetical protein